MAPDSEHNRSPSCRTLMLILAHIEAAHVFCDVFTLQLGRSGVLPIDLARELFVDASTVSHWRKAKRIPQDAAMVYRISKVLGSTPHATQRLYVAWSVQKQMSDLATFIKEIIHDGACTDEIVEQVKGHLSSLRDALNDLDDPH